MAMATLQTKSVTLNITTQCKWHLPSFRTEIRIFAKDFPRRFKCILIVSFADEFNLLAFSENITANAFV